LQFVGDLKRSVNVACIISGGKRQFQPGAIPINFDGGKSVGVPLNGTAAAAAVNRCGGQTDGHGDAVELERSHRCGEPSARRVKHDGDMGGSHYSL
jgi:hypothetical protein